MAGVFVCDVIVASTFEVYAMVGERVDAVKVGIDKKRHSGFQAGSAVWFFGCGRSIGQIILHGQGSLD